MKAIIFILSFSLVFLRNDETILPIPSDKAALLTPWNENCPYDASVPITEFSVEMAMYYTWFASYAYCEDEDIANRKCCGKIYSEKMGWEVFDHGITEKEAWWWYKTNYVVLKNDKFKKFVIAMPGTNHGLPQMFAEIIGMDLVNVDDNSNIKIGSYTKKYVESAIDQIFSEKNMEYYKAHKDYQFIFTGHSLGASSSSLLAFYFLYFDKYKIDGLTYKPVVINLASPRAGNADFAKYMDENAIIFRVVKEHDPVPHVPFCGKWFDDVCPVSEKDYIHSGRMYLIDDDRKNVIFCGTEDISPSEKCKNTFGIDWSNHRRYFMDEEYNYRCFKDYY